LMPAASSACTNLAENFCCSLGRIIIMILRSFIYQFSKHKLIGNLLSSFTANHGTREILMQRWRLNQLLIISTNSYAGSNTHPLEYQSGLNKRFRTCPAGT
ncbi:MAG: hypothetical protein ACKOA0_05645, partial [Burkholderiaceae bacterium]